jgi:hypothetical protein
MHFFLFEKLLFPQVTPKTNIIALLFKIDIGIKVILTPFENHLLNRANNLAPTIILINMLITGVFENLLICHKVLAIGV